MHTQKSGLSNEGWSVSFIFRHIYGQQLKCNTWHWGINEYSFMLSQKYFILLCKKMRKKITKNSKSHYSSHFRHKKDKNRQFFGFMYNFVVATFHQRFLFCFTMCMRHKKNSRTAQQNPLNKEASFLQIQKNLWEPREKITYLLCWTVFFLFVVLFLLHTQTISRWCSNNEGSHCCRLSL